MRVLQRQICALTHNAAGAQGVGARIPTASISAPTQAPGLTLPLATAQTRLLLGLSI